MSMDYQAEYAKERKQWIDRMRVASTLDAAFLLYYYNHWTTSWGPPPKPLPMAQSEVFSDQYPEPDHEEEARAGKMYKAAFDMVWSGHEARSRGLDYRDTYEPRLLQFKDANPGFSESSYELAIYAANVAFR